MAEQPPQPSTSASASVDKVNPPAKRPYVPPPPPKNRVLRFLGINVATLREFTPSRKTALYVGLAASPLALYLYDRAKADKIRREYVDKVAHLRNSAAPQYDPENVDEDTLLEYPRKVWVMSTRVPDDPEEDRANRWFKYYIKPVLASAGYDYSFLNGTAPGALGRRVRDQIRLERIANLAPSSSDPSLSKPEPGQAGYSEYLDKRRHARAMGLTVVVGRNTFKEYLWGLKQGWLADFDAVQEERGEEGRLQDLREELDRDGVFDDRSASQVLMPDVDDDNDGLHSPPDVSMEQSTSELPPSALLPPRSAFSMFSSSSSSSSPQAGGPSSLTTTQQQKEQQRSLVVNAVAELPEQPPLLVLPFDHPIGYLRHWPIKMFKYLFLERYRVQRGCETALAIIQATHPEPSSSSSASSSSSMSFTPDSHQKGFRGIQPPRRMDQVDTSQDGQVALDDIVTENKKKLLPEWSGEDLPESGSEDLDRDLDSERHYRKTFNDTPVNIISNRKNFYDELPEKLKVARELENRERLPTKEEQKYPPPTEDELKRDRLNKEKKWRNDLQGWLMTRRGSKVTWDARLENLKVLDVDLAKRSIERDGFVADRWQEDNHDQR